MANENDPQYTKDEAAKAAKQAVAQAKAALRDDADAVGNTRRITTAERAVGAEVLKAAYGESPKAKPAKPSRDFQASMERSLAGLSDDDEKPQAKAAPKAKSVARHDDPVGDLIQQYAIDNPPQVTRKATASLSADTDPVIHRAQAPLSGGQAKVEAGIERLLTPNGKSLGDRFMDVLANNSEFAARFGASRHSTGRLDLNGDGQVEGAEYEAIASKIWKDRASGKSISQIAESLGNDKQIAAARKEFGDSLRHADGEQKLALRVIPEGNDHGKGGGRDGR